MKFHDLITDRVSFVYVPMKFLNVVVKNFIKSFYAKELWLLLKPYLESHEPAFLSLSIFISVKSC